jgi:hypothetical protein
MIRDERMSQVKGKMLIVCCEAEDQHPTVCFAIWFVMLLGFFKGILVNVLCIQPVSVIMVC